jgi:hypothetical protein
VPDGQSQWLLSELAPGESVLLTVRCLPLYRGVMPLPRLQLSEESAVAVGSARVLDVAVGEVLVV